MRHRRSFLSATALTTAALVTSRSLSARTVKGIEAFEDQRFQLADGRQLSYATYGDPAGWPVLYFHGIPTSRIEARFFAAAACRMGCYLIAIDRPGYGSSTFQCNRRISHWLADVQEFVGSGVSPTGADLSRFSVTCFSSGSAYALHCATQMPPEQLTSVGIVDGIAPLELIQGCGGYAQIGFTLASKSPRLAKKLFDFNTRQMKCRPDIVMRRNSHFFSPCDRGVFFEPQNARILIDSYLECVRCGANGVIHDMSVLAKPWGVCFQDVTVPVGLWYGRCDITTPVRSMGAFLNRALPDSDLTVFDQQGHLSMLNQAGDQMFEFLLANRG